MKIEECYYLHHYQIHSDRLPSFYPLFPLTCPKADAESDSDDDAAATGSTSTSTDAAANDDLALINALTGAPLEGDSLLYVVPVCGPYSIMNNFKFKVKLTPGM